MSTTKPRRKLYDPISYFDREGIPLDVGVDTLMSLLRGRGYDVDRGAIDWAQQRRNKRWPRRDSWGREITSEPIQAGDMRFELTIVSRAKGGDGRTVEGYAAVFNRKQEIVEPSGRYAEEIDPRAFDGALLEARRTSADPQVLLHHGMSIVDNEPDPLHMVPLGVPLEIRPDGHGLRTVSRYHKSDLADAVLGYIKDGTLTGQSFRGRIYRSDPPDRPRAGWGEPLPLVRQMQLGLRDYGPTPSPYYRDASITAVRAHLGRPSAWGRWMQMLHDTIARRQIVNDRLEADDALLNQQNCAFREVETGWRKAMEARSKAARLRPPSTV